MECRLPEADKAGAPRGAASPRVPRSAKHAGRRAHPREEVRRRGRRVKPLANDILYQSPWDAWGNLGLAYLEKGKVDEAIEALSAKHRLRAALLCRQLSSRVSRTKKRETSSRRVRPSRARSRPIAPSARGCKTRSKLVRGCIPSRKTVIWRRGTWRSARKSRQSLRPANVVRPA